MAAQHSPPSGAIADLPVAATAVGSFLSVFGQLALVVQAAKGAFLLVLGASLLALVLPAGGFGQFFLILVGLAASCHFGVNWCRIMLMGPQGLPARSLSWEDVHWRFLGYGLLLALIMLLVSLPLSVIGSILAALFGLVRSPQEIGPGVALNLALVTLGMFYVLARLGFVFPAVAAGESYGLGLSWQHTAGQGARLTATFVAVLLPVTLAQLVVSELLMQALFGQSLADMLPQIPAEDGSAGTADAQPADPSKVALFIFNLLSAVVNFLSLAIVFSLICLAFRTLTGWVPAGAATPPPASLPGGQNGGEQDDDAER